jgi:hypothetical protein
MLKLSVFFGVIIILTILLFGFLFFEPFLTETEEVVTVINKEKWMGESGRYFIFTENEVFLNVNNYFFNDTATTEIYTMFRNGFTYKVKVVGLYLPFIPRFRNIMSIIEHRERNVPLPQDFD